MAKMYSQKSEIRCIKTLTTPDIPENKRMRILSSITSSDYFNYPPCKAAHGRIMTIVKKKSEIITFSELIEDPVLEKDFREILTNAENIEPCGSAKEIRHMVDTLEKYRKIRAVYEIASKAMNGLNEEKFDIDIIIEDLTDGITKARQITSETDEICVIGKSGNSHEHVKQVLYSKMPPLLKTGYDHYDNLNGGLPVEGVMLIAATTSGGKSTMLLNLMRNLYRMNKISVCKLSLEMSKHQEMNRLLANLSGIHYKKFVQGLLTKAEKREALEAHDKFYAFGERNECRFASMSPEKGMTIDDVFITMKPYGFDVLGIDYISLLKGVSTENQWRIMGDVCAQAKTFSRQNKCLVILLAQLDDDSDKIRYSNGMRENCDVLWKWNYSKEETRKTRILDIIIGKARDGELDKFPLSEQFELMRIENPIDGDSTAPIEDDEDEELLNTNAGVA